MKILIAEDDPVSRRVLEALLVKWGHEAVLCSDGVQALRELQKDDFPPVAILDWMMPGLSGIDVCKEVRKLEDKPYRYLILLTARGQMEDIIKGMNKGADDYITKPFDPHELKVRLNAGERIVQLQDDLIAAREALEHQATHDPLTGLWNRKAIMDFLKQELIRSQRERSSLGVIMADIDFFKQINDKYGHVAGDAVLRSVSQKLILSQRPYDAVGRYGGEEFLVILPNCTKNDLATAAERIRFMVAGNTLTLPEGEISVTISLGATTSEEQTVNSTMNNLIKAADSALYMAKDKGRNRVEMAWPNFTQWSFPQ